MSSCIDYCSRSYAAILARSGKIHVDSIARKPSYKVRRGEFVLGSTQTNKNTSSSLSIMAEPIVLKIVYEDSSIIVINKDAGVVVHPSPGHTSGTIVNAVVYRCPDLKAMSGTIRPGVVHRLDKDTTGLLVLAKNVKSVLDISSQFERRIVVKQYLAIVYGAPSSNRGTISFAIGRHQVDRKKMSIHSRRSRSAETSWKVLERYGDGIASLLELKIKTGRTHQIRVHCTAVGHPIVGDHTYKDRGLIRELLKTNEKISQLASKIIRPMLHAYKIKLRHPENHRYITFKALPQNDMVKFLNALREMEKDGKH